MSDEEPNILGNRLKRAGITPEEYNRAIYRSKPNVSASTEMLEKLERYVKMEPGEEKTKLWTEIEYLMGDVADELHEISTQRPSAYILADQLKEQHARWEAEHPAPKKPTIWNLLFGKKK
ncbi:hypothetical protein SEA_ZEINA_39 [Arthrobacter phage Zeina]|nr:hypothetical protein SEA_ZEINA_39 [Arthrobacter phage Zeina]